MAIQRFAAYFLILALSFLLTACGGSSDGFWNEATVASNSDSSVDEQVSSEDAVLAKQLGRLQDGSFVAGELTASEQNLEAYQSISVSGVIYDEAGDIYLDPVSINFSSVCTESGLASLTSPQTSTNGEFKTTYTAAGCVGEDVVTATAFINDEKITAAVSVQVEAAVIHAIRFESASPTVISIKGFGEIEESIVKFKLVDKQGRAVPNQTLLFSASTAAGGIALSELSTETDTNGIASTVIHSGSTATSIRVTAKLASNEQIFATSDAVVVSTGVADQNSMVLSASVLNPEAWDIVGNEVQITAWAADHFNNPVPDGIKVYFTTEGGQIDPNCSLINGSCSVTWRSAAPYTCHGRSKILAVMTGEESFIDSNGNAILDQGEIFYDMPEAFRDDNENGQFDSGLEEFWDFNQNGTYDQADGKYNGVLCNIEDNPNCSTDKKNIYVRSSIDLVMAGSNARMQLYQANDQGVYSEVDQIVVGDSGANAYAAISGQLSGAPTQGECEPVHEDASMYQTMPAATTVSFELKKGELLSESNYTIASTNNNGPGHFPIFIAAPDEQTVPGESSLLTIKTETKGANNVAGLTSYSYFSVLFDFTAEERTSAVEDEASHLINDYVPVPTSMSFVANEPSNIGISGYDLAESSQVSFQLKDQQGVPVAGQVVNFVMDAKPVDVELSTSSAITNEAGYASVTVHAGNTPALLTVTASLSSNMDVQAQSDELIISTGVANQQYFKLSTSVLNPEALDQHNETVTINVTASDYFDNPVPDGSVVYFMAEGGQIDPECQTLKGQCNVVWTSTLPKPDDARVTILATMRGEEGFIDSNGNRLFDETELFDDLGEAFLDVNENGLFDSGQESFKDFNKNDTWDHPDGKYNGLLCKAEACDDSKAVHVRDEVVLLLSGSQADVKFVDKTSGDEMEDIQLINGQSEVNILFTDQNGNALPKGTMVELNADGLDIKPNAFIIESTNSVQVFPENVSLSARSFDESSVLTVTVTTPSNKVTIKTVNIR